MEYAGKEGLGEKAYFTGDIMYDTFLQAKEKYRGNIAERFSLERDGYVLMTWHRQENTDSRERMEKILNFLCRVPYKIICPVHPRTKKMLLAYGLREKADGIKNLVLTDPVGYSEMVYLQGMSRAILTDSGGLSKESVFAGARCLFMLDLSVWPDLERIGWLRHIDFDSGESVGAALDVIKQGRPEKLKVDFYGDGHAAEKMADRLEAMQEKIERMP